MTTAASAPVRSHPADAPSRPASAPGHGATLGRALLAEWTKLRSVRSSLVTMVVTVGVTVGLGALITSAYVGRWDRLRPRQRLDFDPTSFSLNGVFLGQLAIAVLGVLVVTSEFSSGMIRTTFAAMPRRPLVMIAKTAVFAAVTLVVAMLTSFAAFLLGQVVLSQKNLGVSLTDPSVLRAVVGGGLYLTLVGLFGLGFGAILRHTAGAISAVVGVLLVLPIIAHFLPGDLGTDVNKFLPSQAGSAIMNVRPTADSLAPWNGLGMLCLYTVVVLVVGGVLLAKRDV
jgi:ABC-type transport system involved in multi-copper enzyme maturation permease subunit